MSELVSYILEPLTHASAGSDIDSTGSLLYQVNEVNRKIIENELDEVPDKPPKIELKDIGCIQDKVVR